MQINTKESIVDSSLNYEEAIAQNPDSKAPDDILAKLELIPVSYIGFDGTLHKGQIVMHKEVAEDMKDFFAEALKLEFPIKSVVPICVPQYAWNDELSCADNNTAGFNYRLIAGTNKISKHAKGLAFDINPAQNIFLKYDAEGNEVFRFPPDSTYDPKTPGTLHENHPLVKFLVNKGWEWGGSWTRESGRIDYQHFEKDLV